MAKPAIETVTVAVKIDATQVERTLLSMAGSFQLLAQQLLDIVAEIREETRG